MIVPRVSVIIPNYNHAPFLRQRVQSVLAQTYPDFEVIYLDDASTDRSAEVFAEFASLPQVRAVVNAVNSGSPFRQWQRGIDLAQGEYIWIAESDDYADPTLLETLVAKLDQWPQVGLAYCQSWHVNQGTVEGTLAPWTAEFGDRWQQDFVASGPEECRQYLLLKNTIPNASAVVFRRSLYAAVGGTDPSLRLCGDWLLWSKLLSQSDLAFVSQPLNYFRTHSTNTRKQVAKQARQTLETLQVLTWLSQTLEVPEARLRQPLQQAVTQWAGYLMTADDPWAQSWEIYTALVQLTRSFGLRAWLHGQLGQQGLTVLRYRLGVGTWLKRLVVAGFRD